MRHFVAIFFVLAALAGSASADRHETWTKYTGGKHARSNFKVKAGFWNNSGHRGLYVGAEANMRLGKGKSWREVLKVYAYSYTNTVNTKESRVYVDLFGKTVYCKEPNGGLDIRFPRLPSSATKITKRWNFWVGVVPVTLKAEAGISYSLRGELILVAGRKAGLELVSAASLYASLEAGVGVDIPGLVAKVYIKGRIKFFDTELKADMTVGFRRCHGEITLDFSAVHLEAWLKGTLKIFGVKILHASKKIVDLRYGREKTTLVSF